MTKSFTEALRLRCLAGLPVILGILLVAIILQCEPNRAFAQGNKLATSVGQVNGTPTGVRGQRVRIDAGLSRAPRNAAGYWSCLSGPVKIYVARGGSWRYLGQANAVGCSGGLNGYATASFQWLVPRDQPRGHQRFKFEYPGDAWFFPSVGFGNVWVP